MKDQLEREDREREEAEERKLEKQRQEAEKVYWEKKREEEQKKLEEKTAEETQKKDLEDKPAGVDAVEEKVGMSEKNQNEVEL